ncbi:MAG: twitch domain-containing radical SAM protein [Cytophagales bacterium]|nr:twitch domain-containing radical SAM protein [Cytophagales bacterium]
MKRATDSFCIMPWVHFHSGQQGKVCACCIANIPFGNVNQQTIEEIWNGPEIRQFRLKLLNGEKDNRCSTCFKREDAGHESERQSVNQRFRTHIQKALRQTQKNGQYPHTPVYWDIRFSNKCNFRCRTCWHGNSSRWFEDAKKLSRNIGNQAIIQNITDTDSFFSQLDGLLPKTEEFYFAGGEPLIMDEHYHLLKVLDQRKLHHIHLRYNTNLSLLNYRELDVLKIWKKFDRVTVQASLDASGKLGEYIRKGQQWDKAISNRKKMLEMCPEAEFVLCPTVSTLNLEHLPNFLREWKSLGLLCYSSILLNLLERPYGYNIKSFSANEKQRISALWNNFASELSNPSLKTQILSALNFMNSEDLCSHQKAFVKETTILDHMRNESFQSVMAEQKRPGKIVF